MTDKKDLSPPKLYRQSAYHEGQFISLPEFILNARLNDLFRLGEDLDERIEEASWS